MRATFDKSNFKNFPTLYFLQKQLSNNEKRFQGGRY